MSDVECSWREDGSKGVVQEGSYVFRRVQREVNVLRRIERILVQRLNE
jgi:hypothetical protein